VVAFGRNDEKLAIAKQYGADAVINLAARFTRSENRREASVAETTVVLAGS
jgi:hypothetical protein